MVLEDSFPTAFNTSIANVLGLRQCYCNAVESAKDGASKSRAVVAANPLTGKQFFLCPGSENTLGALSGAIAALTVTIVNMGLNSVYSSLIDFEGMPQFDSSSFTV